MRLTWSSFVRFRPAAFKMEARMTMARPIINATTDPTWCAGTGSKVGGLVMEGNAEAVVEGILSSVDDRIVDEEAIKLTVVLDRLRLDVRKESLETAEYMEKR